VPRFFPGVALHGGTFEEDSNGFCCVFHLDTKGLLMNWTKIQSRKQRAKTALIAVGLVLAACIAPAAALTIPVNCGMPPVHVGDIVVNPSGSGMSGDFTSVVGGPPATMAAACAQCGEDHMNWFQVVTADNMPPNGPGGPGNQLTPPYIDPPFGGYGPPDQQWADNRPWYWDETVPPGPPFPPGYQAGLGLGPNTFADHLHWEDFPGGAAGSNVKFSTWLVSLNADGSLHEFHEGFSWMWSNPGGGAGTSMIVGGPLTPQQGQGLYGQLVPEPATFALVVLAFGAVFAKRSRNVL